MKLVHLPYLERSQSVGVKSKWESAY